MKNLIIKWIYTPRGNCPIQAEGYFLNHYFYFKARYETAFIEFCKSEEAWERDLIDTRYTLLTTDPYLAGWLPLWQCRLLIWKGCFKLLIDTLFKK